MSNNLWHAATLGIVSLLILGACGAEVSSTFEEIDTENEGSTATSTETAGELAAVCPDPVVIQTDWFPEAEYGATYELVGDDYEVDVEAQTVTGGLVSAGEHTGIDVEVRTGGPAIGNQPVSAQMYVDPDITVGFVNTAESVFFADDAPTIAVVAPLEKSPQIIMWDPETYPSIRTIADLGDAGVTVNVFPGATFPEVLVSLGILMPDQIDPSYSGNPSAFIAADGAIAQQGFASAEPYNYEQVFEEWMRPVAYELIHDAGFRQYSQAIAIRAEDLDPLSECLAELVPIYQQAAVDYITDPGPTNALIVDAVAQFDDFWVYDAGVAEFSAQTQRELGLVGNGPDDTIGNLDPGRVQEVIDQMADAGMEVPGGTRAADIMTNQFIDESIGLDRRASEG